MFPTTNFRPAVVHLRLLCGIIITVIAILDNWGWTESCLFQQQGRPRKAQQGTAVLGWGEQLHLTSAPQSGFSPRDPVAGSQGDGQLQQGTEERFGDTTDDTAWYKRC